MSNGSTQQLAGGMFPLAPVFQFLAEPEPDLNPANPGVFARCFGISSDR
jgi:hypothetical protein